MPRQSGILRTRRCDKQCDYVSTLFNFIVFLPPESISWQLILDQDTPPTEIEPNSLFRNQPPFPSAKTATGHFDGKIPFCCMVFRFKKESSLPVWDMSTRRD